MNANFSERFSQFSENAQKSLRRAAQIATELGAGYICTEHLLLGVLAQKESTGARILKRAGITFDRVHLALLNDSRAGSNSPKTQVQRLSEQAKLAVKKSWEYAQDLNQEVCGTEHILFTIFSQSQARATEILTNMNVSVKELQQKINESLASQNQGGILEIFHAKDDFISQELLARGFYHKLKRLSDSGSSTKSKTSVLDHFSTNLTAKAEKGLLDPVIGRAAQIARTVTILNRRQKNNPVLIGEPGVGKTAIVEGLAQKIVAEDVPESLLDRQIVTLDLASMIAGTKYRGEFEDRFRRILAELTKNKKTILFIDEIHLLVGAGAAEGAIDASNMLKPALARGSLQVIGATTTAEYTKQIEKDAALERRLQPILVPGTSPTETLAILRGLAGYYEDHHRVSFSDGVLEKAVQLADRYLNDRQLPDKAIDLIDEAAAHLRVEKSKINPAERQLSRQIKKLASQKDQLAESEDYDQAGQIKKRLEDLEAELATIKQQARPSPRPKLTTDHLAAVISTWTGVPASQVIRSEARLLLNLEKQLAKQVVGQPEAVTAVANAIRRSRSGVRAPNRPIGSFLFLGPTGVGKTELARVLAGKFYGRNEALIKIDMSEFGERHTVARLIGAPAGYVGFDHPGQLTEKVRRQPYSLVLFDEIEKAHPDVFNLLLQIMEDGCLTDAKGRTVDFTNTIVILTSNLGAGALQKSTGFGFELPKPANQPDPASRSATDLQNEQKVRKELQNFMRPELINRLDKTIVFRALTPKDISKIVDLQLEALKDRLLDQNIGLIFSPRVKKYLAVNGYDKTKGVRPLRRLIQDQVEAAIASFLLTTEANDHRILQLNLIDNQIKVSLAKERPSRTRPKPAPKPGP